jgi:anti-repressor protein
MDLELFEITESVVNLPDKEPKIRSTTKVTGKGQIYFINKFLAGKVQQSLPL